MAQSNEREQKDPRRQKAEDKARQEKAVDEEALAEVIKAAGARKSTPEARKAMRALAEREIARYAAEAAREANERDQEEVDAECVACAAAEVESRRRR